MRTCIQPIDLALPQRQVGDAEHQRQRPRDDLDAASRPPARRRRARRAVALSESIMRRSASCERVRCVSAFSTVDRAEHRRRARAVDGCAGGDAHDVARQARRRRAPAARTAPLPWRDAHRVAVGEAELRRTARAAGRHAAARASARQLQRRRAAHERVGRSRSARRRCARGRRRRRGVACRGDAPAPSVVEARGRASPTSPSASSRTSSDVSNSKPGRPEQVAQHAQHLPAPGASRRAA